MNVYIGWPVEVSDMQWPAPDGFHVPLSSERWNLTTIMSWLWLSSGNDWKTKLHLPFAWYRNKAWWLNSQWVNWFYYVSNYFWSSDASSSWALELGSGYGAYVTTMQRIFGCSIRAFYDSFVTPESDWTVVAWVLGWAWIFWNQIEWIISITSDGSTWYTIADKNLWATTVYNDWDTLSEANCWKYYQWGNNYGFSFSWGVTTSSNLVDTTWYWPWNYYESDTFIANTRASDWSSDHNPDLRWWVSQWTSIKSTELKNAYIGEYGWKPWANTLLYIPMDATYWLTDQSDYWRTISASWLTHTTFNGVDCYQNSNWSINLWTSATSWLVPSSLEFTANFWVYKPDTTAWTGIFAGAVQSLYFQAIEINDSQKIQYHWWNPVSTEWSIVDNNARWATSWHLLTITIKDWVNSFYIDSNLIGTNSWGYNNWFGSWHTSAQTWIYIYAARTGGWVWSWYVWEVIMEDKWWSSDDITKYFNQKKSNYWL